MGNSKTSKLNVPDLEEDNAAVTKASSVAAAKQTAKKATAKKATAKKATAKKATAKKATAKKATAKKATAKKATAKKATAKKATAKKAIAKKAIAKKATAKKATAKKATAKKATAKKATPGKVIAEEPQTVTGATAETAVAVAAANRPTITREDGRYALPATVKLELPEDYHPSESEEYMCPKHLAYFRKKLNDWRNQLIEESRQTMDNLKDEVRDVGDEADRAARETDNSLELRTRDRYRKLIAKIEKALRRIEEGSYGFCEETDEEIGLKRLDARPIATLSLDAQERREHKERQMGD